MHPAIIVVDMLKDSFNMDHPLAITKEAIPIIPRINHLLQEARSLDVPVLFACDSFLPDDFIFKGRMRPHSLRGTKGAEIIDELDRWEEDVVLPKRRFSAFFKTDLDQTLRTWGIDTVAIAGIATNVCVLATAMDALCHDFCAFLLQDCCAAHKKDVHDFTVETWRKFALYPLARAITSDEFLTELKAVRGTP
jgi:nicotinamidase-related amidase